MEEAAFLPAFGVGILLRTINRLVNNPNPNPVGHVKKFVRERKRMTISMRWRWRWLVLALTTVILNQQVNSASATCELSVVDGSKLYNYSLVSPIPEFPHGVLSEDGFYEVAANGTVLWFQLCDAMIFNHYPPRCIDCKDCGGPSRCGMACGALVADNIGGYPVCTTIGHASTIKIHLIDEKKPHVGVVVNMSNGGLKNNCSLAVSVICDSTGVQGPQALEKIGTCDYATQVRHPRGCATIVSIRGKGLGWFGTFVTMLFLIWNFGPVYHIELRVGLDPWCGNSEDLWKVIGAPILLSTSEEVVCEIAVSVFDHLGCFTDQANVACDQILQFMETGFHSVTTSKVGLCTRCKSSVFP